MIQSRNPMLLAWSVIALFALADAVGLHYSRLTLAPGTFWLIATSLALLGCNYIAATVVVYRLRSDPSRLSRAIVLAAERTKLAVHAFAFIIASGATGIAFFYLAATLGLPLRDAELSGFDKAIGFDWLGFLAFTNQYPLLSRVLSLAYHSSTLQLMPLILFLAYTRQGEDLGRVLAVLAICNLMTGIILTAVPAEGAYPYYHPARELFSHYTAHAGTWHMEALSSLRNDAAPSLDFTKAIGLVTFPSFHTTMAIITIWAVRNVRYISLPVAILNTAVIVATLPEGGHHLIDLFVGAVVAMVAIILVQTYTRQSSDELPRTVDPRVGRVTELAARLAIVAVFTALAVLNLAGVLHAGPIDGPDKLLSVAARSANFMFLILVAATALTRLSPIRKARGIEPRVSALLGAFLSLSLTLLPKAELGPVLSIISTALIIVGAISSFVVLRWLGKSFSILAEARRLVTAGPYKLVRHPLYLCEGIALIGIALQVFSPLAVAITFFILSMQFRRMHNEEEVLLSVFPEYQDYAARTPRVIPVFSRVPRGDAALR